MGWTVDIQHSSGTVTLDANYRFDLRASKVLTGRNVVEYVDLYLDIKGQVVESTPGAVADETKALADLAMISLQAVTVTIKLDGTTKWSFTPTGSVGGPTVLEFDTEPDEGNGGSKWAFSLVIFVRLPGNNFAGLHELHTSLAIQKNVSGEVVSKVWQATGKALTITKALAGILKFKPSGKVSEEIVRSFDPDPTASATWVWRRSTISQTERIQMSGGGRSYEVDPQAGVNVAPLLHLARRGAWLVQLDGILQGAAIDSVVAPPAHWKESATMKRQFALETQSFPTVASEEDRDQGRVTLAYQEIWVCTGAKVPPPNHGSHATTVKVEAAPADGAIAR